MCHITGGDALGLAQSIIHPNITLYNPTLT